MCGGCTRAPRTLMGSWLSHASRTSRSAGSVCSGSHRAASSRVEPHRGGPCLDPDGLPSLAHSPTLARRDEGARRAGVAHCPWPGIAGPDVRRGYATDAPLDELARCSRAGFASCAARVPDRHPGHPPRPEPGRLNTKLARAGSTAAPVASLGGTAVAEAPAFVNVWRATRGSRRASKAVTPAASARAPLPCGRCPSCPVKAHRDPPTAPPSASEGDLWGDLQCGGAANRLTVSSVGDRVKAAPPPARP